MPLVVGCTSPLGRGAAASQGPSLTTAARICFVQQTDQLCERTRRDDSSFPRVRCEPCRAERGSIHTQSNLFRLKTRASRVSTVPAPHRGFHNEAYVVYAFTQTHNPSAFTAPDRRVGSIVDSGISTVPSLESVMPSFLQPKCPHNADTDLHGVVVSEKQEGGDLTSINHLNVLIVVDSCERTNFANLQSRPLHAEPRRRQPLLFQELRGHCFMEGDMRTMSALMITIAAQSPARSGPYTLPLLQRRGPVGAEIKPVATGAHQQCVSSASTIRHRTKEAHLSAARHSLSSEVMKKRPSNHFCSRALRQQSLGGNGFELEKKQVMRQRKTLNAHHSRNTAVLTGDGTLYTSIFSHIKSPKVAMHCRESVSPCTCRGQSCHSSLCCTCVPKAALTCVLLLHLRDHTQSSARRLKMSCFTFVKMMMVLFNLLIFVSMLPAHIRGGRWVEVVVEVVETLALLHFKSAVATLSSPLHRRRRLCWRICASRKYRNPDVPSNQFTMRVMLKASSLSDPDLLPVRLPLGRSADSHLLRVRHIEGISRRKKETDSVPAIIIPAEG
ncbi:hypothetical protein D9C73_009264 [Collichthys lucidus]|uniref:Uncharacterized protein n=1 Tax=Collichthys lucidus TaxID=240159 RepID=A0A4U5ULP8_COLLU|nr:hypothetical protein D9C73_009264 [Collichthys lucidus]